MHLEIKDGSWAYSTNRWQVPNEGAHGVISDQTTGEVFGITNNEIVQLMSKDVPIHSK